MFDVTNHFKILVSLYISTPFFYFSTYFTFQYGRFFHFNTVYISTWYFFTFQHNCAFHHRRSRYYKHKRNLLQNLNSLLQYDNCGIDQSTRLYQNIPSIGIFKKKHKNFKQLFYRKYLNPILAVAK